MNSKCSTFDTLRKFFPDELDSGEYNFKAAKYKDYFSKSEYTDIDKINGYFLWLLNNILKKIYICGSKENCINVVVVYTFGWLSYKLNQKTKNGITKLNEFYSKYMENANEYKQPIDGVKEYTNYIDFINKNKKLMDIDIKAMSKFYNLFHNLCKMYNELSNARKDSNKYLEYVKNFAEKYNSLFNETFNDTNDSLFKQVLSITSNDYNYIKSKLSEEYIRNQFPELTKEKKAQVSESSPKGTQMDDSSSETSKEISESKVPDSETKIPGSETRVTDSETTLSSSLIINKLISIPFILVITLILLGIAYKVNNKSIKKYIQQ
ncbi:putative bir1 protein [Plasmodium yoelii yoelii]|uniref:Bir1 protein n=1 Tax=Plasmodium yoelii yoelii TaxID=73239 RepID=Q7RPH8_PLAYO|nr:putative bir1 protein [Plasmodium yoelii yoelii]